MPKVSLSLKVNVKRERLDDFLKAMQIDAEGTRAEPGNLRFDVVRLPDDGQGPVVPLQAKTHGTALRRGAKGAC